MNPQHPEDREKENCDRCGTNLNGEYWTHYGEALCDTCDDARRAAEPAAS